MCECNKTFSFQLIGPAGPPGPAGTPGHHGAPGERGTDGRKGDRVRLQSGIPD